MEAQRNSGGTAQKGLLAKKEFEQIGTNTTIGVLAGMLYGGCKEALGFSGNEQILLSKHSGTKDHKEQRQLLREIMEQRVLRVARGTVVGGAKLGLFTAFFCTVQSVFAIKRNVHDTMNIVAAGSVTAATFGLLLPGSFLWRMRTAMIGSVLGATLGVPLGLLQTKLHEQLETMEDADAASITRGVGERDDSKYDAVGDAIQRLEESLSSK